MVIISTGALCLFIWIYLLAAHGGFWRLAGLTDPRRSGQARPASVAVVVPARNEADVVGLCLASLLQQASGNAIHVYLVDDGSTDCTAQVAQEAARGAGQASLTVIAGKPIAAGWSGKLWAVQQGIEKALAQQPDYLLLTDADILHGPENISTLIQIAEDGSYDLVSFMVKLHCRTLAEKLLIPAFVFFFLKLYPPAWIADPHRRTAGAAGGCILIRPEALARAGGIESIRGEIIDDCALANRVKRSGGRIWLGLTTKTQSIRPYGSFREIGRMISRAAFNQLHHS
ncbi:MAG TPA: glycosyltransferase, partial [Alphaproteobacteria bacterium]|nr:glycosyltransferase [Alphaproteobacteria bacterium]